MFYTVFSLSQYLLYCEAVFIVLIAEQMYNVLHCILFISCEAVFIVLIAEQMYNVLHCILFILCEAVFIVLIAEQMYIMFYTVFSLSHVKQYLLY